MPFLTDFVGSGARARGQEIVQSRATGNNS
jgi:hypothetical protein